MNLLEKMKEFDYLVPRHSMRVGYMLGGMAGLLLIPLFVSGLVLAFFGYVPSADMAYKSVADITASGNLSGIRSAHALAADTFLILLFLHVVRIVLTRSYYGPRKRNWFSGIFLLCVASLFFYTGITLKWDQAGYEAYAHIDLVAGMFGLKGALAASTPSKMFVIHAIFLPMVLAGVLGGHMLLVKINGISPLEPGREVRNPDTSFLLHVRHVLAYGLFVIGLFHLVAAFYTPPLLSAHMGGVEWTKPAWPFLFLYPLPTWGLVAAPFLLLAGLVAVPFFADPRKKADASQLIFVSLLALWAGLSLYGAFLHL